MEINIEVINFSLVAKFFIKIIYSLFSYKKFKLLFDSMKFDCYHFAVDELEKNNLHHLVFPEQSVSKISTNYSLGNW